MEKKNLISIAHESSELVLTNKGYWCADAG